MKALQNSNASGLVGDGAEVRRGSTTVFSM
jgi:hypothetical protein